MLYFIVVLHDVGRVRALSHARQAVKWHGKNLNRDLQHACEARPFISSPSFRGAPITQISRIAFRLREGANTSVHPPRSAGSLLAISFTMAAAQTAARTAAARGTSWTRRWRWVSGSCGPVMEFGGLLRQYSVEVMASSEGGQSVQLQQATGLRRDSSDEPTQAQQQRVRSERWKSGYRTTPFVDLPVQPTTEKQQVLQDRPGATRFLKLRELAPQALPGMSFDLRNCSLSVDREFPSRLMYVQDTKHHEVKPWISKALLSRAESWHPLDYEDLARVRHPEVRVNSTTRRHRGRIMGHASTLLDLAATQKPRPTFRHKTWTKDLGPTLPPRVVGHLDGMRPEDVSVLTETHLSKLGGRRLLSCIVVAVNAPLRTAALSWDALAQGQTPRPDLDALQPIMRNFAQWLKEDSLELSDQKPVQREQSPLPRQMITDEHVVPVVFAWRQKYIWFLWTGGIDGQLVAQYASHWLPINEVGDPVDNLDNRIKGLQDRYLRQDPGYMAAPNSFNSLSKAERAGRRLLGALRTPKKANRLPEASF